jgi:hypothetical protein
LRKYVLCDIGRFRWLAPSNGSGREGITVVRRMGMERLLWLRAREDCVLSAWWEGLRGLGRQGFVCFGVSRSSDGSSNLVCMATISNASDENGPARNEAKRGGEGGEKGAECGSDKMARRP